MDIIEKTIPLRSAQPIRSWHAILFLALLVFSVSLNAWAENGKGFMRIHLLDVGQGDAIFVTTPNGTQVLIDGGPPGSVVPHLAALMPSWDRTIDLVVASHPHSDHIGGLIDVLEQYEAAHIMKGFEAYDSATAREWERLVAEEGAIVTEGLAGVRYDLGASVSLSVLLPARSRAGMISTDANEDSLVFLLQHEQVRILFTGDAEQNTEAQLVSLGSTVSADILKAGHHGSITSTTPTFLSAVHPQAVLISAGEKNRYGHPHPVMLGRLESAGIPYYRTDQRGNVTVTSDGRSFSITTQY